MIESRRVLIPGLQIYAKMLNGRGFLAIFWPIKGFNGNLLQAEHKNRITLPAAAPSSATLANRSYDIDNYYFSAKHFTATSFLLFLKPFYTNRQQ
ncbi:hypothetical protein [Paraflavitalea pollutisoli]|uniref:hypothetical protein n=1 Tax=Paraflavitalea pollutisoli TaxID=3034143 RepID=UPI0023EB972C|nr:hypothetical protein [Paraflavitalea sp. H1-2-19X]